MDDDLLSGRKPMLWDVSREPAPPKELARHVSALLLEKARALARSDPDLVDVADNVLVLADAMTFRTRIPAAAIHFCRNGAWAYPGGRKRRMRTESREDSAKMRKFYPDVEPVELIDHGWTRIYHDIKRKGHNSEFAVMTSADALVIRFCRKMEDRIKLLAQREANIGQRDESVSVEAIAGDDIDPAYPGRNIVDIDAREIVWGRQLLEKVSELLDSHPDHKETIRRRFFEELTPREEAEKYGLDIADIQRRRDAALQFLRRNLKHLKDDES